MVYRSILARLWRKTLDPGKFCAKVRIMNTTHHSTIHYPGGNTMTNSHDSIDAALDWARTISTRENALVTVTAIENATHSTVIYP